MSIRINMRFPDELVERIKVEAKECKVTMTDVVIYAIEKFFKSKKKEGV